MDKERLANFVLGVLVGEAIDTEMRVEAYNILQAFQNEADEVDEEDNGDRMYRAGLQYVIVPSEVQEEVKSMKGYHNDENYAIIRLRELYNLGLNEGSELFEAIDTENYLSKSEMAEVVEANEVEEEEDSLTYVCVDGSTVVLSKHDVEEVFSLVRGSEKIRAIKLVREKFGIGIKEASSVVEKIVYG